MYRGANLLAVDEKGRVAMPARYRQSLLDACGGQLVVTAHLETCLLLYPSPAWSDIEQRLAVLPDFEPRSSGLKRHLIGHATEIEMDKQGRMLLPPVLRDYARLGREVMLVGRVTGFELWDGGVWNAQRDAFLAASKSAGSDLPEAIRTLTL